MWTSPEDRKRAELRSTPLTKRQKAAKAVAERAFNAGFDAAIRATTPAEVLRMVRFDHWQYMADRREKFERWHLEYRMGGDA